MKRKPREWRLLTLLAIALAAPFSKHLIRGSQTIQELELLAYDWHCRALAPERPDPRIALVGMDDESLSRLNEERYTRRLHAHLVDVLREAQARVVAFDVMFTRESPEDDAVFAAALKRFSEQRKSKVIAALLPQNRVERGEEVVTFIPPASRLRPYLVETSILVRMHLGRGRWLLPYPADIRTTRRYLHIAFAVAAQYFGDAHRTPRVTDDDFQIGRIVAPLGLEGEMLIRFAGPPLTFDPVPYHEVYTGTWRAARGADFFRDKIILIGRVSGLEDQLDTPVGRMQGVEIIAHAAQTVLRGNWLRRWSKTENYLFTFGLCLAVALAVWQMGLRMALPVAVLLSVLWLLVSHLLFIRAGIWADMVEPLGALAAMCLVATLFEERRVRSVFHRFMPAEVADRMLLSDTHTSAQTERIEATIVFCDVRSYTSLSETLPPETTEEILRQYFVAGEEAAERLGTELDKFVGDEIMLYVTARKNYERHALRAVWWALEMQKAARRIHDSGIAGDIGFRIGIGICSGRVRVGEVGAQHRIQHTVIGDAVNTASRLQSATKEVGRGILMAESTYQRVSDCMEVELLGEVRVKGKQEPVRIYCPLKSQAAVVADRKRAENP